MRFCVFIAVAATLLLRVPAAVPQATTEPADPGRHLFEAHCASCHGPRGEGGRGPTLALPTLSRAKDDAALQRIISNGIPGTEMPGGRLEGKDVHLVAAFVKSLGTMPVEQVPGDPNRGAQLYAAKGQCAKCHMIRGEGSSFGPDLTDIGRRRSTAYLRRSLLDPNADVPQSFSPRTDAGLPQNFLFVRVVTRDGADFSGARINEDTFSIQIRDALGRVRSFSKADLSEFHKDWGKSPMPSYAGALTTDEIDDLVAYMVSLRDQK
jgi:putative heme-binding domain-containing protein